MPGTIGPWSNVRGGTPSVVLVVRQWRLKELVQRLCGSFPDTADAAAPVTTFIVIGSARVIPEIYRCASPPAAYDSACPMMCLKPGPTRASASGFTPAYFRVIADGCRN
jgi:hypothetical protein